MAAMGAGETVQSSSGGEADIVIIVLQESLRKAILRAEKAEAAQALLLAQQEAASQLGTQWHSVLQPHHRGYTRSQYGSAVEKREARIQRRAERRAVLELSVIGAPTPSPTGPTPALVPRLPFRLEKGGVVAAASRDTVPVVESENDCASDSDETATVSVSEADTASDSDETATNTAVDSANNTDSSSECERLITPAPKMGKQQKRKQNKQLRRQRWEDQQAAQEQQRQQAQRQRQQQQSQLQQAPDRQQQRERFRANRRKEGNQGAGHGRFPVCGVQSTYGPCAYSGAIDVDGPLPPVWFMTLFVSSLCLFLLYLLKLILWG